MSMRSPVITAKRKMIRIGYDNYHYRIIPFKSAHCVWDKATFVYKGGAANEFWIVKQDGCVVEFPPPGKEEKKDCRGGTGVLTGNAWSPQVNPTS